MLRKVIFTSLAFAFSGLTLVGCTSNQSSYSMNDQMFAAMMIPHHEQAVEMADLATSRTDNPEILALAQEIRDAQEPEIEQMKTWGSTMPGDHMGHSGMNSMGGMLSQSQLQELEDAKGREFDRLFLRGMIAHHEGAIDMAQMILDSDNKEVRTLGENIVRTQQIEIDRMRILLKALGN